MDLHERRSDRPGGSRPVRLTRECDVDVEPRLEADGPLMLSFTAIVTCVESSHGTRPGGEYHETDRVDIADVVRGGLRRT